MKKFLLPLILLVVGTGAGVGAAIMLKKPAEEMAETNPCGDVNAMVHDTPHAAPAPKVEDPAAVYEYVKMNNQFIIPLLGADRINSMVVLSLSVEVAPEAKDMVLAKQPKLRDQFLQVLFDHANIGGFSSSFTNTTAMDGLKQTLLEVAQKYVGPEVHAILVTDIVRRDG